MPRRRAEITQADVARAVRAAKQAGAAEVQVFSKDGAKIVIVLAPSTAPETPVEPAPVLVL